MKESSPEMVTERKFKPDDTMDLYRARLVAHGFAQIPGIDYTGTYAPVVKMQTL